jgi:cytochrome c-type biogenesis protein
MTLLIVSFLAGALTVAAPCILPLLPVVVGGGIVRGGKKAHWWRPLVITGSLVLSVIVFTLLLKATTSLLGVPQMVWQFISAFIVILLGLNFLFPEAWDKLSLKVGLHTGSNRLLGKSSQKDGIGGDILMGAALGPVFSSCSPTYALIVATLLPASFAKGLVYLLAYAIGLGVALLLIAYAGQGLVQKLGWLANPHGNFRKVIGVLFILVGLMVLFGIDKDIQTYVLEQGWYDPVSNLEQSLR